MHLTRPVRIALLALALIVTAGLLARALVGVPTAAFIPVDDFVEYWAAGRLNLIRSNPYGSEELLRLQAIAGRPADEALMMWTPPWSLALAMPLGALDYPLARVLWLVLNAAAVFIAAAWTWQCYAEPALRLWVPWSLAVAFAPALFALRMGQISPLILLGIAGFLYWEKRGSDWLAGALVALVSIKPHLSYLFWIALVVWAIDRRKWAVLLASISAIGCAGALSLIANPSVVVQYLKASADNPPFYWATPTIGMFLRLIAGMDRAWLQFVPALGGLIWFVLHWSRCRKDWQWAEQLPRLLLISVATAAYGWSFDQVVLVVPMVQIAALMLMGRPGSLAFAVTAGTYLAINLCALAYNASRMDDYWYLWMAPALLLWHVLASRLLSQNQVHPSVLRAGWR